RIPDSGEISRSAVVGRSFGLGCLRRLRMEPKGDEKQARGKPENAPSSHLAESEGNPMLGVSRPSVNTTFCPVIAFAPFFTGRPVMITWSPGFSVLLLQPLRER